MLLLCTIDVDPHPSAAAPHGGPFLAPNDFPTSGDGSRNDPSPPLLVHTAGG